MVHHALCNWIVPFFKTRFITNSFANRVGKGTHRALDQLQAYARRYRYVLRADVIQHFPSHPFTYYAITLKDDPKHIIIKKVLTGGIRAPLPGEGSYSQPIAI